ncbi:MAG TPA: hypothetical protein VKU87_11530 [Thermomicrobiaceae bacterium]|nr:hypothetical protein [Thermomicrobiaceae bacterium]
MPNSRYQIIGRRLGQPQNVLFKNQDGRYFLRAGCGARLVRLTARDAERLMFRQTYHTVLDSEWYDELTASGLDCALILPDEQSLPESPTS